MRWAEVDWKQSVWIIPAAKAKAGEVIRIPRSPAALQILENRKLTSASEWVFPGRSQRSSRGAENGMEAHSVARKLNDPRLHDLRRTLGS